MRLICPLCGDRDLREYAYKGHATYLNRPDAGARIGAWDDHLHLRENPAGPTRDLWQHVHGCAAWLVVERDTTTHAITSVALAKDAER